MHFGRHMPKRHMLRRMLEWIRMPSGGHAGILWKRRSAMPELRLALHRPLGASEQPVRRGLRDGLDHCLSAELSERGLYERADINADVLWALDDCELFHRRRLQVA